MTITGRVYVLSSAIALVAMASRTGWIHWSAVGGDFVIGLKVIATLIALLIVFGLLVGLPAMLLIGVAELLAWLFAPRAASK